MNHRNIVGKIKSKSKPCIITLLTDFGLQDQYVASMKGVILSINPAAQIIDITHEVQPYRIRQAGYLLWAAYKYFPRGTIFVNVVDPGVGSKRRIVAMLMKGYTFLAPDNGLLDLILSEQKVIKIVEISQKKIEKYLPQTITSTFHGRDIFAPLAAYLSIGIELKKLGDPLKRQVAASPYVRSRSDTMHPCILNIDRFGNIITNLFVTDVMQMSKELQAVSVGRNLVSRWISFYDEAPENTPCLLVGSGGLVEISVKNNNAARLLNANLDTPLKIYWR